MSNLVNPYMLGSYDPDANIFFIDTGITDSSIKDAINVYILDSKENDNAWRSDSIADWPFVGTTSDMHGGDLMHTYPLTFVNTIAGDHTATGWVPNGTDSYARTGAAPSVVFSGISDFAEEFYFRDNTDNTSMHGSRVNNTTKQVLQARNSDALNWDACNQRATTPVGRLVVASIGNIDGGLTLTRLPAPTAKAFRKGSQVGITLSDEGGSLPNIEMYLGAHNNNSSAQNFDTRELAGAAKFNGLTDAQVAAQYNARQTLNTTLSRQV